LSFFSGDEEITHFLLKDPNFSYNEFLYLIRKNMKRFFCVFIRDIEAFTGTNLHIFKIVDNINGAMNEIHLEGYHER